MSPQITQSFELSQTFYLVGQHDVINLRYLGILLSLALAMYSLMYFANMCTCPVFMGIKQSNRPAVGKTKV